MRLPDQRVLERDLMAARRLRMIDVENGPVPRVRFATTPATPAPGGFAARPHKSLTIRQV
jgi:hypothetical protein